ncbi:MAG TPA: sigma-54 dependent transcriptional regulator [Haliangium sp.]|nr:sigma-54 dependent transcriptional regulator [Haliangium sp.]
MVLAYTDSNSYLDADTLVEDARPADAGDEAVRQPVLTILHHPDLNRVGERAFLPELAAGNEVCLSRLMPAFAAPGRTSGRSLRDPYLSRKPVRLRVELDYVEIHSEPSLGLLVNGRAVEQTTRVPLRALDEGVVLEIAQRVVVLLHKVKQWQRYPRHWELVGESDAIIDLRRQIGRVADLDVSVLIRGETGVGKERVAQAIHAASRRAGGDLVAVNMAALAPGTAASELFGHERGSFTSASGRHVGLFERAHGSTLFLDEIGETPVDVQTMLLRTLAESAIRPLGARADVPVDVRIIAATDANLERARDAGAFRSALLYRLSGYEIRVPPLRERREDIPRLVVHFLGLILAELGESWRLQAGCMERRLWLPPALMARLYRHPWPGNVRQLCNTVRQIVIAHRGADTLGIDASVERILAQDEEPAEEAAPREITMEQSAPVRHVHDRAAALRSRPHSIAPEALLEALRASDWSVPRAAELLGVPRATLYSRMARLPGIRKATDLTHADISEAIRVYGSDLDAMAERLCVSRRGLKLRMKALGIELT